MSFKIESDREPEKEQEADQETKQRTGAYAGTESVKSDQARLRPPMIVLSGPTAVGKTQLSIALAKAVGGEIISADSMQVYEYMDIGSAKISRGQMEGVPHHMIDILKPWEPFNVAIFKEKCMQCLPGIYERGHIPVLTGGTGFYVQALLKNIDFCSEDCSSSGEKKDYRVMLEELAASQGSEHLHRMLEEKDPASAQAIHANNVKRTIRALEYFYLTGEPISRHNEREREKKPVYEACYFVLNDLRERIYDQIDRRVDKMIKDGLVEEVRRLRGMGCHRGMVSMQGLGYKEILAYLEGECTLEEAAEILKRNTRHFAKRQLTWFRREKDVIWVNKNEFDYDDQRILAFMLDTFAGVCKNAGSFS